MLEMHLNVDKKSSGGEVQFIEELSNAQFTTYANLSSLAGISQGTLHNEGSGWLRFDYEGTELIVAKKSIRHSISWDHIHSKGCVFGTKTVTIGGVQYKVRLLTGADHNPTQLPANNGYFMEGSHNSEWSRLFYPLVNDDTNLPAHVRNPDAPYTNLQLGMVTEIGLYSWCQETPQDNATFRVVRGYFGVSYLNSLVSSGTTSVRGWRACLERI